MHKNIPYFHTFSNIAFLLSSNIAHSVCLPALKRGMPLAIRHRTWVKTLALEDVVSHT